MKNKYFARKIIAILCVLILLISCFSALSACSQQTLSSKEEAQIKQDLLALMELDNDYRQTHNIAIPSIEEIELRFLGKFNGYTILYINSLFFGDNAYAQLGLDFEEEAYSISSRKRERRTEIWKCVSIKGKENPDRKYALWGYKDGTFYKVEYLYIFGYINYDQLIEIKNNFTHISTESRKAAVKYTQDFQHEILKTYVLKYKYVRGWEFQQREPSIALNYVYRLVAIIDKMVVVEIYNDRTSPAEATPINLFGNYNSQKIGGYVFESDYTLQVYREGELVDLNLAYLANWLTDCELKDLYSLIGLPYALQRRA